MHIKYIISPQVAVSPAKLSSSGLEAGGEDYREILEEECGGVAITPDEPIKDPLVTLGELALGGAQLLLASAAASGVCVLFPAKAWLSSHSPSSSMLKIYFL